MIHRRSLMKLGLASITSARALPALARADQDSTPSHTFSSPLVIADPRQPQSLNFSRALQSRGARYQQLRGDTGALWYSALRPALASEPRAMTGLSDTLTLFCLEELARDLGMRVRWRVEHQFTNGGIIHQASDPGLLQQALAALPSGASFGAAMAAISLQFHGRETPGRTAQKQRGPWAPTDSTLLVSWLID